MTGKSTFLSILIRLNELDSGIVSIDGLNIASVPLSILRSRISVVTQDSYIFSGTVRSNLDPFGMYKDEAIQSALERALVWKSVQVKLKGIYGLLDSKGGSLSHGEKSQIGLARALLKNSKIILIDEATGKNFR